MSENLSRRRFLRDLTVLGAAALLPHEAGADPAPKWVSVGPAEKFPVGGFTQVHLSDGSGVVYVSRNAKGAFLALSAYCTHKGCLVAWDSKPRQFVCPCHQGRYDDTGRNISGPPPRPLPVCQTRTSQDGVLSVLPPARL